MSQEDERPTANKTVNKAASKDVCEDDPDALIPHFTDLPEAPKIAHVARPAKQEPGRARSSARNKTLLATQLAGAFTSPILVLTIGGYLLDRKFHHQTFGLMLGGMALGLIIGVSSAIRIFKKLIE